MVFLGLPVLCASSAWDISLSSRISRRVSPGAVTTSGSYRNSEPLFMGILHSTDLNLRNLGPVQTAVGLHGHRVVTGLEEEAVLAPEIHREDLRHVALQFVAATRQLSHRFEIGRIGKVIESQANDLGLLQTELLLEGSGVIEKLGHPSVPEGNIHGPVQCC